MKKSNRGRDRPRALDGPIHAGHRYPEPVFWRWLWPVRRGVPAKRSVRRRDQIAREPEGQGALCPAVGFIARRGSVVASEVILQATERVKRRAACRLDGDVAASGGYYVSALPFGEDLCRSDDDHQFDLGDLRQDGDDQDVEPIGINFELISAVKKASNLLSGTEKFTEPERADAAGLDGSKPVAASSRST